jgi:hypothetical protein
MSLFGRDAANRGDWIDLTFNRIAGISFGIFVGVDRVVVESGDRVVMIAKSRCRPFKED